LKRKKIFVFWAGLSAALVFSISMAFFKPSSFFEYKTTAYYDPGKCILDLNISYDQESTLNQFNKKLKDHDLADILSDYEYKLVVNKDSERFLRPFEVIVFGDIETKNRLVINTYLIASVSHIISLNGKEVARCIKNSEASTETAPSLRANQDIDSPLRDGLMPSGLKVIKIKFNDQPIYEIGFLKNIFDYLSKKSEANKKILNSNILIENFFKFNRIQIGKITILTSKTSYYYCMDTLTHLFLLAIIIFILNHDNKRLKLKL